MEQTEEVGAGAVRSVLPAGDTSDSPVAERLREAAGPGMGSSRSCLSHDARHIYLGVHRRKGQTAGTGKGRLEPVIMTDPSRFSW